MNGEQATVRALGEICAALEKIVDTLNEATAGVNRCNESLEKWAQMHGVVIPVGVAPNLRQKG